MKCSVCGSYLERGITKCSTCGHVVEENIQAESTGSTVTRSKTAAGILMLFGGGDFYLLQPGRFFKKFALGIPTCFIYPLVASIVDAIKIFTGKINCDAHGNPLE